MLLIGDVVEKVKNRNPSFVNNDVEIFYDEKELKYIEKQLNVKIKNDKDNKIQYIKKKDKKYILFKVNNSVIHKNLYNKHRALNNKRISPDILNYCYYKSKLRFRNINVYNWLNDLHKYLALKFRASEFVNKDNAIFIKRYYSYFLHYNILKTEVLSSSFKSKGRELLTEEDSDKIREIVAVENNHPKYPQIFTTYNEHISFTKWNVISYKDKVDCCVEKLLYDMIVDYIIPRLKHNKNLGNNPYIYYAQSIMNTCTDYKYDVWFTDFIINNIEHIKRGYTKSVISIITNLYKKNCFNLK